MSESRESQIRIHDHARLRMIERGASEDEVFETLRLGEAFPAKHGRLGFRRSFAYSRQWRGRVYATKQIEAIAVVEEGWLVITVLVKYF